MKREKGSSTVFEQSIAEIVIVKLFVAYIIIHSFSSADDIEDDIRQEVLLRMNEVSHCVVDSTALRIQKTAPISVYFDLNETEIVKNSFGMTDTDKENVLVALKQKAREKCVKIMCDIVMGKILSYRDYISEVIMIGYASKTDCIGYKDQKITSREQCNQMKSQDWANAVLDICLNTVKQRYGSASGENSWFREHVVPAGYGERHTGAEGDQIYQRVEFRVVFERGLSRDILLRSTSNSYTQGR